MCSHDHERYEQQASRGKRVTETAVGPANLLDAQFKPSISHLQENTFK